MKRIGRENVGHLITADAAPAASVAPGEAFVVETEDAYGGSIAADGDEFPMAMRANPATGPIAVTGALPGDVLRVDVDAIELPDTGAMSAPTGRVLPIRAGQVVFGGGVAIPVRPMVGVIGTAPRSGGVPTHTPGEHGGNLDCKEIRVGSALFLPVNVEGALLSLGDVHALMGDGEVCGCGVEVAAEVTLRTWIVRAALPTPCVETDDALAFIASGATLDASQEAALNKAHDFLTGWLKMDEAEALRLMSLVGDLAVCQVVNPLKTMRFSLPKDVLAQLGLRPLASLNRRA